MGSLRYLNAVLTVLVVLCALTLWTLWSGGSAGPLAKPAYAVGIPNAGQQRQQIVDQLKQLSQKIEALHNLFRSGQARVKLEAAPENNH